MTKFIVNFERSNIAQPLRWHDVRMWLNVFSYLKTLLQHSLGLLFKTQESVFSHSIISSRVLQMQTLTVIHCFKASISPSIFFLGQRDEKILVVLVGHLDYCQLYQFCISCVGLQTISCQTLRYLMKLIHFLSVTTQG
jgi:hypothetical protein